MKIDLDVRTPEEWGMGHKDGAVHFDLQKLMEGETPNYEKDTEIQIYCQSGSRADMACEILKAKGFTNVHNAGGFWPTDSNSA